MTALARFEATVHHDAAKSKIIRIFETKIFYLIRGRNAWHSTWVTHYYDQCMHDDLRSAKARAEELRERGSVFTIREQPALAFQSKKGIALVTEINTPTPLHYWIKKHHSGKSDFALNQDYCQLERLFSSSRSIGALVESLQDRNVFPRYLPAMSKNLFALWSPNTITLGEDHRTRLKKWTSFSNGGGYYLGWSDGDAKISGRAVRRIAQALTKRLENVQRRRTSRGKT